MALSAASTTSAPVFALACFISASVRLASSRMRRRSRSVKPSALSLAEAAGEVFASLELLKPGLRGFDLFRGFRNPRRFLGDHRLGPRDQRLVFLDTRGPHVAHGAPESLVALGVRLLDHPLLIRRHHRDAVVQRGVDLGLIVGADAVPRRVRKLDAEINIFLQN
jgi:hypothetical protein